MKKRGVKILFIFLIIFMASFISSSCGDLVCESGENEFNCAEDCSLIFYEPFESQAGVELSGAVLTEVTFVEGKVGGGANIDGGIKFPNQIDLTEGAIDFYIKPQGWNGGDNSNHMLFQINPGAGFYYQLDQINQFYIMKNSYSQLTWRIVDENSVIHFVTKYVPDLVDGQWTRITVNWKNINSWNEDAEMHLYINGVDVESEVHRIDPQTLTYNSEINISEDATEMYLGNSKKGYYPANAVFDEFKIYDKSIGIPEKARVDFGSESKVKPIWQPPEGKVVMLVQSGLPSRCNLDEDVAEKVVALEKEYFDAITVSYCFDKDTQIQSNQLWIDKGQENGLDIALDSAYLIDNVGALLGVEGNAERLLLNGDFEEIDNVLDYGDKELLERLVLSLKDWFGKMNGLAYYFNNEGLLQITSSSSDLEYYLSPTYSDASLQYFRDYLVENYGDHYTNVKFPVDKQITINSENEYKIAYSDDPFLWARWFEWRRAVFANYVHLHAKAIYEANEDNPNWKGYVYFVSFGGFLDLLSGIDLDIISSSPYVDWLIMEQSDIIDFSSVGIKQLDYAEQIALSTKTLFGSYVLAWHYYDSPPGPNLISSIQAQFEEGINHGVKMIVPYHDFVIIPIEDEDGEYPTWYFDAIPPQNAKYNLAISNLWGSLLENFRGGDLEIEDEVEESVANTTSSVFETSPFSKTQSWEIISPGVGVVVDGFEGTGINKIEFWVKSEIQNVGLVVARDTRPLGKIKEGFGEAYSYFKIEAENLEKNLDAVAITLQVPKNWLNENNVKKGEMKLFQFDEGKNTWERLATAYVEEDESYYHYTSNVDSFGYFAMASKTISGSNELSLFEKVNSILLLTMVAGGIIGGIVLVVFLIKNKYV